jgi:hypothetical protein
MVECEPFRFKLPGAVQVSGPSNVGKSVFVAKVLKYRDQLIEPPPQIVFYCYSVWQPELFSQIKQWCPGIHFYEGLQPLEKLQFDPKINHVIVLDDLMSEVGNSDLAVNLFTKIAHHGNILIFFITQNIFLKSKHMVTINKNIKYNVVFRNKRFRNELEILARQTLGLKPQHIHKIMEMAAEENSHPYIVLDLQNHTEETKSIVTNILPGSTHPQAFYYVDE